MNENTIVQAVDERRSRGAYRARPDLGCGVRSKGLGGRTGTANLGRNGLRGGGGDDGAREWRGTNSYKKKG